MRRTRQQKKKGKKTAKKFSLICLLFFLLFLNFSLLFSLFFRYRQQRKIDANRQPSRLRMVFTLSLILYHELICKMQLSYINCKNAGLFKLTRAPAWLLSDSEKFSLSPLFSLFFSLSSNSIQRKNSEKLKKQIPKQRKNSKKNSDSENLSLGVLRDKLQTLQKRKSSASAKKFLMSLLPTPNESHITNYV